MLSYQHGYHAGNHADVLKHVVLVALLAQLTAKDKPLRYIDTHSGAGSYDLRSAAALKNREHAGGIGALWGTREAPAAVMRWLELVRRCNDGAAKLARYPGSPWLASESLRASDSLYLFELHPSEHRALEKTLGANRNVTILRGDGLKGCIGLVPPPQRRGLVLIDPSYELKDEHSNVLDALTKAHRRFASGTYAIWYPVLERRWVQRLERAVRATGIEPLALYELSVMPDGNGRGLTGSGMLVVNPPWKLGDEMDAALPWLARELGVDGRGAFRRA
jgi:23S rRNA (adenine2030-N6)-methyltransferase